MAASKRKVLRIINRFNLGGPTYNAAYLTRYLDDRYETLLVGGAKDDSEASSNHILEGVGLKPRTVGSMKRSIGFADLSGFLEIHRIIKEFKPDIVHTHASKAGTLGRLAAMLNGVPIIVHTFHGHVFHSYFGTIKTNFYKAVERFLANRSTRIVAISKQQKLELCDEHRVSHPEKTVVIPLGFDLSRFRSDRAQKRQSFRDRYGLSDQDIAVTIVGRLVPIKNHQLFLQIAASASRQNKNLRFFIVGDGESRSEIETVSKALNLDYTRNEPPTASRPICFTSWIKDVDWVYAGCDIVCLTSLNEGTPVSLIEAQSAAKPVVSTRVGGIHDIVDDGKSGFLFELNQKDAMTQALLKLASDDFLREKMGATGEQFVSEKFDFRRLCNDMTELYDQLFVENQTK
ncbi:MAG: glycosyltransferase family 4 protein [Salibacteraceae bacterium]